MTEMYTQQQPAKITARGAKIGCLVVLSAIIAIALLIIAFATENYSEGERIGFLTKFSKKGRFWKSWEGELNLTQTGMNTSSLFEFSIDNDKEDPKLITMIDSAVSYGWKVKLTYHETFGKNWFRNRGETDYFVKNIQILSKNPVIDDEKTERKGHIIDTIFVVIDKSQLSSK
jgi:hypothetical protein